MRHRDKGEHTDHTSSTPAVNPQAKSLVAAVGITVFEIHPKSRIQYCERSELRLHFKYQKFIESAKNGQFGNFLKN